LKKEGGSEYRTVQYGLQVWHHEVWDTSTGKKVLTLEKGTHDPGSLAYSRDDETLVLSRPKVPMINVTSVGTPDSDDAPTQGQESILMDAATGVTRKTLRHGDILRCVRISADSKFVLGGTMLGDLICWDVSTGKQVCTLHCHLGEVLNVAISPDGNQIATGGKDGLVRLWDFQALRDSQQFDLKK
jgi:WD40 repeat protein